MGLTISTAETAIVRTGELLEGWSNTIVEFEEQP